MQRLLSVLEGEAKRSVEAIGHNGIFYTTALKSLKRDLDNPVIVSQLKIQFLLEQPQIKPNNKVILRHCHQQVKITNIWLLSMGYKTLIISYENLIKTVAHLSNYLRTQFFKATCDYGTINLLSFEAWLKKQVKDLFNPLAQIILLQDAKSNKHQHIKDQLMKNAYKIHTNHLNKESKLDEKEDQSGKQMENQEKTSCWLCKQKHHLMDCPQFKDKSVEDRIDFARKEKLCKNCFSKGHTTKDCICKLKCRANSSGKKHHTLLHRQDQRQVSISSSISHKKTNLPKTTIFLQVLPVKVSNGSQTVEVNALLDTGSDTTIITSKLADELQIKGVKEDLNISSAIAEPVTVVSRLANSSLSSKHHP